jgi:hypothetical protein
MSIDIGLVFKVYGTVLAGPILLIFLLYIFTVMWRATDFIKEKTYDNCMKKIIERQKRVNTYYETERKKQHRWKIQRPALALSKEFDKIIGK